LRADTPKQPLRFIYRGVVGEYAYLEHLDAGNKSMWPEYRYTLRAKYDDSIAEAVRAKNPPVRAR
jgi:hypothetical protein